MIILTEEIVYLTKNFFNSTTFIITISVAAFIGLIISIYLTRPEEGSPKFRTFEIILLTFLIILASLSIGSLIGAAVSVRTETIAERTEYEIYLEDMTYNELAESPEYTIVSVEGKKITIVNKEWRYYEGYEK